MTIKDYFEWKKRNASKDKYQKVTNENIGDLIPKFVELLDKSK